MSVNQPVFSSVSHPARLLQSEKGNKMDDMDSLLDSLMQQQNAPDATYIDDKHAKDITLRKTISKGQGLFAERHLSVHDPICSVSYPTMMAIDSEAIKTTCYHCLVISESQLPVPSLGHPDIGLKTCNGCLFARFCSRDCQLQAWHAYHKYECKLFKKLQPDPGPPTFRAVMRAVLLRDRALLPDDEWNRITQLTSNEHILATRGRSNLTDMADGVKHLTGSSMSSEQIQKLIFVMKYNLIELPTPIHGGIGVMLDPLVAKFNHSCEPNISIHRLQHTMSPCWTTSIQLSEDERKNFVNIIPLRDIQKGEELLNCYIVPTVSVHARKHKLQEDYFFECTCPRCESDVRAATDLAKQQPDLPARYSQWVTTVLRPLSRLRKEPKDALQKAAAAVDKVERFLEYPVLYTTGDFPQMALGIVKETLKAKAYDEALVNMLRVHFLVNPERFVGRDNPTHIYTCFLMLDIFDAILDSSTPTDGNKDEKSDTWLRQLSGRGISKESLVYWRSRVHADLKNRLEQGAQKDLLGLLVTREEKMQRGLLGNDIEEMDNVSRTAEEEMRITLGLKEDRWKTVLQKLHAE